MNTSTQNQPFVLPTTKMSVRVHADKVKRFNKLITKLNKICAKAGQSQITATETGFVFESFYTGETCNLTGKKIFINEKVFTYELDTPDISKVGGYTLVGILNNKAQICTSIKGQDFPMEMIRFDHVCSLCGLERNRNQIFILQKEDASYTTAGSNCVRDVIGVDASFISRLSEAFAQMVSFAGFEDETEERYSGTAHYDLATVLRAVIASMRVKVYTSMSTAEMNQTQSTKEHVIQILSDKHHEVNIWDLTTGEQDYKEVFAAIDHFINTEPANTFEYNLKSISEAGVVASNHLGYAIPMIKMFRDASTPLSNSQHYGFIGEKVKGVALKLINSTGFSGSYGYTYIYTFQDEQDNQFVYMGTKEMENLEVLRVDFTPFNFTIKDHTEFKDVKQTKIIRVKAV